MKTLFSLILGLVFVAGVAKGQDGSDSGRFQASNSIPLISLGGGLQFSIQPQFTPILPTSIAIAETNTPDIQALAGNLGNDPARIFNFVHDQIRYVHYF